MKNQIRRALALAVTAALFALGFAGVAAAAENAASSSAAQAFNALKSLAGNWEANSSMGKVSLHFRVVSNGTAVVENMSEQGKSPMVTVYYLDGNRLLLTHYCDSGNQPRMEANGFTGKTDEIHFHFLDATNLASAKATHMHNAVIKIAGPDQLAEDWTLYQNGKPTLTVALVPHRVSQ